MENRTITVPESVDLSDIEKMVNILNERLSGVPIAELNNKIFKEMCYCLTCSIFIITIVQLIQC